VTADAEFSRASPRAKLTWKTFGSRVRRAQPDAGRDAPDRGATATVARELESEIHGLLFFETLG
jgi:hypothetical protein